MNGQQPGATGIAALSRRLSILFVVAVMLNYPWELAQGPLFAGHEDFTAILWHCFVASLGDGVLVLLIFAIGWLAWRRQNWFVRPGARGYGLMLTAGLLIGITVEWLAVHVANRWVYSPSMPLVPGLAIGLIPVIQMIILPPAIFQVVAVWAKEKVGHPDGTFPVRP